MFTFLAGALTLLTKGTQAGWAIYLSSWGIIILTGSVLGTLMFLNVWLIIWPKQQVVIASTNQVAEGGEPLSEAADSTAKAGLASRTNTLFSIPMLLCMGAASHFPVNVTDETNFTLLFWVLAIIIGLIGGFLLFPAPDFSKSLLVGIILPIELFPKFVSQSLLFLSFLIATFFPVRIWKLR